MGSRRAGDYSKFAGKGSVAKQIKVVEKSLETDKSEVACWSGYRVW
jgi:hypothetical protein